MKTSDTEKLIALVKTFPDCNNESLDYYLNKEKTSYGKLKALLLFAYQLGYSNGIQYVKDTESYRNFQ